MALIKHSEGQITSVVEKDSVQSIEEKPQQVNDKHDRPFDVTKDMPNYDEFLQKYKDGCLKKS